MINIDTIISVTKLHKSRIHNIYVFGSRVYGTANDTSDYDILVIANTPHIESTFNNGQYNIHVMTIDRFLEGLRDHKIRNIECLMAPDEFIIQENKKIPYTLNTTGFIYSIVNASNSSFKKFKKKLETDRYIAFKSLYHSIRMVMYGQQILINGTITDWTAANDYYNEIFTFDVDSDDIIDYFNTIRKKLITELTSLNKNASKK